MTSIENELLEEFYRRLAADGQLTDEAVAQLKALLGPNGSLKPDDLMPVFDPPPDKELP
jgi:hypothetical protein